MTAKGGNRSAATRIDGIYDASDVTPSNTVDLPDGPCRAIWVGVAGDVKITTLGGTDIVLPAMVAGMWHPQPAKRIFATGTTATGIKAGY
jgi:hypothetical protein